MTWEVVTKRLSFIVFWAGSSVITQTLPSYHTTKMSSECVCGLRGRSVGSGINKSLLSGRRTSGAAGVVSLLSVCVQKHSPSGAAADTGDA